MKLHDFVVMMITNKHTLVLFDSNKHHKERLQHMYRATLLHR